MTVRELEHKTEEYLKSIEEKAPKLANFFKDTLKFAGMKSEGVAAIRMQCPNAQCVKTAQEWRKLGYRPKQGEFARAIKVLVTYRDRTIQRGDKTINVRNATSKERHKILAGSLSVKEHLITKMALLYDVTQTNCPAERYAQLLPQWTASPDQLYGLLREQAQEKGFTVIETSLQQMGTTNYYADNRILVESTLKDYQKLMALCEGYAQAIITQTTTQTEPVAQFEAAYIALALKAQLALPIDEHEYMDAAMLYQAIDGHNVQTLDNALTRCQRAQTYVMDDIHERYRQLLQAQGLDISMANTQVAQNFIQDLG